jgi:hypothetical protein
VEDAYDASEYPKMLSRNVGGSAAASSS